MPAMFQQLNRGVALQSPTVRVYHDIINRSEGAATWPIKPFGPRDDLVPLTLTLGADGKPSLLKMHKAIRDADNVRADGVEMRFGARIRLNLRYGDGVERELFRGYIGQVGVDYTPNTNGVGFEGEGLAVYGVEILADAINQTNWLTPAYEDTLIAAGPIEAGENFPHSDDGSAFLYEPVIFNPGIAQNYRNGNATPEDDEGHTYFMAPGRVVKNASGDIIMSAEPWTAYTASKWLFERFQEDLEPYGLSVDLAFLESLKADLDAIPISEVNVTGLSAIEAIAKVLNPVGYGFAIDPAGNNDAGTHFMNVYQLGGTAAVPGPWMGDRLDAVAMSSDAGQRVQVIQLRFNRAANNARNDWTILGDRKRLEVTLTWDSTGDAGNLQPFWNQTTDDLTAYEDGSDNVTEKVMSGNSLWAQWLDRYHWNSPNIRRHAFRSFAWNEDGGLGPTLTTIPSMAAYSNDDNDVARRPRPIRVSIVYDSAAERRVRPVQVELGVRTNSGGSVAGAWIKIPARIWQDRAGFTITVADLATCFPYAKHDDGTLRDAYGGTNLAQMIYNTLYAKTGTRPQAQFRISGTIATDDRVVGLAAQQQKSAWPLKRQAVAYVPQRFKRHTHSDSSVAASLYDSRDDREAAEDYAEARRDVSEDALGNGSIVLRGLDLGYNVGQNIAKTQGYEVDLQIDDGSATKRAPTIVGITYNFREGNIQTELLLDTRIMARV